MAITRRGAAFFAIVGHTTLSDRERIFAAAEPLLGCRGRLVRAREGLIDGALFGVTDAPVDGARGREVGEVEACFVAGAGTAAVVLEGTADGAILRADTLGRRTLHCAALGEDGLLVATTIEPIVAALRALGRPTPIDPLAVRRFFTYSYVPAPFTAFAGVVTVPPGHEARFTVGRGLGAFTRCYDVPASRGNAKPADDQAADALCATLVEVVRDEHARRGGQAAGILLSGGLDSAFVAWAARELPGARACTLDFEEDSEADAAGAIAAALGLPHDRVRVTGRDALAALQGAARALDTPIGDPVVVPFFHLGARCDVRTLLTGEGGDQLFAGWATKPMLSWARYASPDDDIAEAYAQTFHKLHDVRHEAFGPALRELPFDPADELRPFLADGRAARHDGFFHLLCDANLWLKGAGNILPRIDRTLGAHGVDAVSPFLDPRFVEAAFAVAPTQKQRGSTEKWILRHALRDVLPPSILDLPKRGMRVPVSTWLAGDLSGYARDMLTSSKFRALGWLDETFVERLLTGEVRSPDLRRRRRDEWLWMALFAAVWGDAWA